MRPWWLLCAGLALPSACFVSTNDQSAPAPPAVASGTLTVDWSIDGSKDPNVCNQSNVSQIRISVFVASGRSAGTFDQDCSAFATGIPLARGDYTADAVLLDPSGAVRTTAVPIAPFTIRGNDNLDVPVDFPRDSFF